MNSTHPIELFLAALLNLFEACCWVINHLAGHHRLHHRQPNTTPSTHLVTATCSPEVACAPKPTQPHMHPLQSAVLEELTVKQMRLKTGIKSSRYRKADLIRMALAHA